MTAEPEAHSTVFVRGSGVLDYWLTRAEGFRVRHAGVVERVVFRPDGRAAALIVRSRRTHRSRPIPADRFESVDPHKRVFVLCRRPPRFRVHAPSVERRAAARGRAVSAARATRAATVSTAVWLAPRVTRAGRLAVELVALGVQVSAAAAAHAGVRVGRGAGNSAAWLAPRLARVTRAGATGTARLSVATARHAVTGTSLLEARIRRTLDDARERRQAA